MRVIRWTPRARADLAAIRAFIDQDSPHYASVVASRLIAATDRLAVFPESGRPVPEFHSPLVREVILRPYRIVYRLVGDGEVHILTVHHASESRQFLEPFHGDVSLRGSLFGIRRLNHQKPPSIRGDIVGWWFVAAVDPTESVGCVPTSTAIIVSPRSYGRRRL